MPGGYVNAWLQTIILISVTSRKLILNCTGYNTFRLDGGSCQVSKVKVRQNVAKSDNLVPVYTANLPVAEQG